MVRLELPKAGERHIGNQSVSARSGSPLRSGGRPPKKENRSLLSQASGLAF